MSCEKQQERSVNYNILVRFLVRTCGGFMTDEWLKGKKCVFRIFFNFSAGRNADVLLGGRVQSVSHRYHRGRAAAESYRTPPFPSRPSRFQVDGDSHSDRMCVVSPALWGSCGASAPAASRSLRATSGYTEARECRSIWTQTFCRTGSRLFQSGVEGSRRAVPVQPVAHALPAEAAERLEVAAAQKA